MAPAWVVGARSSTSPPQRPSDSMASSGQPSPTSTKTFCRSCRMRWLSNGRSPVLVTMIAMGCDRAGSSRPKESLSARKVLAPIMTASTWERKVRMTWRSVSLPMRAAFPPEVVPPSRELTMLMRT